jgi:hypothetical protein
VGAGAPVIDRTARTVYPEIDRIQKPTPSTQTAVAGCAAGRRRIGETGSKQIGLCLQDGAKLLNVNLPTAHVCWRWKVLIERSQWSGTSFDREKPMVDGCFPMCPIIGWEIGTNFTLLVLVGDLI